MERLTTLQSQSVQGAAGSNPRTNIGESGSCETSNTYVTRDIYASWSSVKGVHSSSFKYPGTLTQEVVMVTCTGMNGAKHVLPSKVIAENFSAKI